MDTQKMYLLVTENQTGSVVFERELLDEDALDVDSYLDEIYQATEIPLDPEPIIAEMGQYNIRIGFSNNPEDVHCWESKDFFISDEEEE